MLGQDCGTLNQGFVGSDVLVADGGGPKAQLEGDPTLDLLVHTPYFGLAKCALVLGRHLGAYGQSSFALKMKKVI